MQRDERQEDGKIKKKTLQKERFLYCTSIMNSTGPVQIVYK